MYINPAKEKYNCQKQTAKRRGIDFELSFDEWYDIWQQSGKWEQRGCRRGQYVMSRYNDSGPYTKNNVFIQTMSQNVRENKNKGNVQRRIPSTETKAKISSSLKRYYNNMDKNDV